MLDVEAVVGSDEAATISAGLTVSGALAVLPVELLLLEALLVTVAVKLPVAVGVPDTLQVTVWLAGMVAGCVHEPDGVIVQPETVNPAGRLVMSQLADGASPVAFSVEVLAQVKLPEYATPAFAVVGKPLVFTVRLLRLDEPTKVVCTNGPNNVVTPSPLIG